MPTTTIDLTTPGNSQVTIPSNVSGDTTITCGGAGSQVSIDYYLGVGSGAGGGCCKRSFTVTGGTVLDCHVGSVSVGDGDSYVLDHASGGFNLAVAGYSGQGASELGSTQSGGSGHSSGSWATGSETMHTGGDGPVAEGFAYGGGSGACVTANGLTATNATGAASAGTGSGAGGTGDSDGPGTNGMNGSQGGAGGGTGNGTSTGAVSGNGSIRIVYNTASSPHATFFYYCRRT